MSTHKSYFSKNNTIQYEDFTNTAKNPVIELFYGAGTHLNSRVDYSRLIFKLDLSDLKTKIDRAYGGNGTIRLYGGCGNSYATHTLKMVNTSFFDEELLNTKNANARRRATSFDLILFRVTGATWDEGVGYDYVDATTEFDGLDDKSFSKRPSNWYSATTLNTWQANGVYDYTTLFPGILATQHFDNGNENISMNITTEINKILNGTTTQSGFGLAFVQDLENLTGLTENYSVGFFSKYTQTFFEPYLETVYDDYLSDDRTNFYEGKSNCLYLYVNKGGVPTSLDSLPTYTIYDNSGTLVSVGSGDTVTKGVYCACFTIPCETYTTPCMFTDRWSELSIDGMCMTEVTNSFVLKSSSSYFNVGTSVGLPKHYGYSFSGIKRDEKITNGDIRKIIVSARKLYSTEEPEAIDNLSYRLYVRQGTTEVETHSWTSINIANNQNYFILDTGDMIPNEYFLDIKAISNQETNVYSETIKFQVVNQANYFGNPPA